MNKEIRKGHYIFKKINQHLFNNINRRIVQKPGAVVAYNCPGRFLLSIGWLSKISQMEWPLANILLNKIFILSGEWEETDFEQLIRSFSNETGNPFWYNYRVEGQD